VRGCSVAPSQRVSKQSTATSARTVRPRVRFLFLWLISTSWLSRERACFALYFAGVSVLDELILRDAVFAASRGPGRRCVESVSRLQINRFENFRSRTVDCTRECVLRATLTLLPLLSPFSFMPCTTWTIQYFAPSPCTFWSENHQ